MKNGPDEKRPETPVESPGERLARKLREKEARAAEMPDSEIDELQPPIFIKDYGVLLDGASQRFLLRDRTGRTASLEWNYAIGGKRDGQVLEFRPRERTWTPIGIDVLYRVQKWIGDAVLRGDFPPEYADRVADYAKYAK